MAKEKELLRSIDNRLKWLVRLQARSALEDKTSKEQVKTLYRMGFERKEIAEILDKTSNNVGTQLSQLRSAGQLDE